MKMIATLYAQRARGSPINAPNASHGDGGASLGDKDKNEIEAEVSGVIDCDSNFDSMQGQRIEGRASVA